VCLVTHHVTAQEISEQPHDFPVKFGTEQWRQLPIGGQERVNSFQIPESILTDLSTKALVKTCMNYPLFGDFLFFNDKQKAISYHIDKFNGLKELSTRADRLEELTLAYKNLQTEHEAPQGDSIPKNSTIHFEYIELLLSNDLFLEDIPVVDLLKLKQAALEKYEQKRQHPEIYSARGLRSTLLVVINAHVRIENLQNYEAELNTVEELDTLYNQLKN
jgi:hypothetical protein